MSWILEYFVVCVYICTADYVELLIVLLYLLWCLVYHMLSKTRRNSRSLHRVIACICYVYFDAWCITCCWGISAIFAGGVRFHTAVVFLITRVVVACVILIHGFSRCGYWIWVFCCLLFVMYMYGVNMFGCLCRATSSIVSTSMVYHMLAKMRRSSGIYI